MSTRRRFLAASGTAGMLAGGAFAQLKESAFAATAEVSLDGEWQFRLEADPADRWRTVVTPHTWQTEAGHAEYMGVAWYRREFDAEAEWKGGVVRVEFEAVFHTAVVTVNGVEAGRHTGKGYTAFAFDITGLVRFGAKNQIVVRVDNAFNEAMLPRGKSSDWTHDGGMYRPVRLLIAPAVYIERVDVDAYPGAAGAGVVEATAVVRNASRAAWKGAVACRVRDEATGASVAEGSAQAAVGAGEVKEVKLGAMKVAGAKLWHFDHPSLYRLEARAADHAAAATFGIRSFEVKPDGFYLNGERVRLMGVERMAGSNPEYGMAEPASWIVHDHDDMKELNCVFTRVHWQQDRRLLDYCDRKGILIQLEVPTWGGGTFRGMGSSPSPEIMNNGLEQLREMIARDRNHPSVMSWGLCNEIGGQNPAAYEFARRMYAEAKRLDPRRLASYASNSLQKTPEKDAAGLMDFIEWNEYYESWFGGSPADLRRNLDEIHAAFPGKPLVISEYGYCACTAERPENDARRMEIMREHNRAFRERDYVAGLIFFCYNDYRTHVGDKGLGVAKQRVHGVVDLYGNRKPSFEALREESSPVDVFEVGGGPGGFTVTIGVRRVAPCHRLKGYTVRGVLYGNGDIPLERVEAAIPVLNPGERAAVRMSFAEKDARRVRFDVMRPTGFSVLTRTWRG